LAAKLLEAAAYFDSHCGTPFPLALDLTDSYAKAYLETQVHKTKVKAAEAQQKVDLAVIGRLDAVIGGLRAMGKGFGALAAALRGRR
jgi:hypothetical protein